MDLNPAFGRRQELPETLSQNSAKGTSTANSTTDDKRNQLGSIYNNSAGSSRHQNNSLKNNSFVDEAYRRVGQKLSQQAHGDFGGSVKTVAARLEWSEQSSFDPYTRSTLERRLSEMSTTSTGEDGFTDSRFRTPKVAKTRYSDHGTHHPKQTVVNVLRRVTVEGRESYLRWEQEFRNLMRKDDDSQTSPQRRAFSQLALESGMDMGSETRQRWHGGSSHSSIQRRTIGGHSTSATKSSSKGLLSAVLESHSDSATEMAEATGRASPESASISTRDSQTMGSIGLPIGASLPRGKCLTAPLEGVANDGRDNVEGNLIVHENDIIRIPRKNVQTAGVSKIEFSAATNHDFVEFTIQGLLGQGTFAQVFKCVHAQSGQIVAVKIVKNKPAYTRQATVEIDVFRALKEAPVNSTGSSGSVTAVKSPTSDCSMVDLICYFMYHSHLCLVFELLGQNLYEILKRRQFRGLPLTIVRRIVTQAVLSIREFSQKNIVHCDLKPENVLLISDAAADELVSAGEGRRRIQPTEGNGSTGTPQLHRDSSLSDNLSSAQVSESENKEPEKSQPTIGTIKLIDFGSACFEGYTAHTYIQSRFYRSPEVLVGLPYDSVIDMWSLGCVAAELFLGLPILPGIHEHDQLGRITEMIAAIPDWMLDQGSKTSKYFVKYVPRPGNNESIISMHANNTFTSRNVITSSPAPGLPQWRLKTQQEYIASLSQSEIRKKGGLARLEQQPGNRYFKRTRLADILFLHGLTTVGDDKELLPAFVHFLYGLLEPDPWKRWTSFQAVQHPFITNDLSKLRARPANLEISLKEENQANRELNVYWEAPWDPSICRRKLLNVQKIREKQQNMRKSASGRGIPGASVGGSMDSPERRWSRRSEPSPPTFLPQGTTPTAPMEDSNKLHLQRTSPPNQLSSSNPYQTRLFASQIQSGNVFASSLSSLGHHDQQSQLVIGNLSPANHRGLVPPPPPTFFTGAHSLSGGIDSNLSRMVNDGDFALALQRPGVVPGAGHESSLSSHGQWSTGQSLNFSAQSNVPGSSFPQHGSTWGETDLNNVAYSGFGQGSSLGSHFRTPYGIQSTDIAATSRSSPNQYGGQYPMASGVGVNASVTLSEAPPLVDQLHNHISAQLPPISHQQQYAGQQFPSMQPGYAIQQPQQQQQVYLAAAPGGALYYVTASATGQPILLQPFAVVDPSVRNTGVPMLPNQQQGGLYSGQGYLPQNFQYLQAHQQHALPDGASYDNAGPNGRRQQHHRSSYHAGHPGQGRRYDRSGTSM